MDDTISDDEFMFGTFEDLVYEDHDQVTDAPIADTYEEESRDVEIVAAEGDPHWTMLAPGGDLHEIPDVYGPEVASRRITLREAARTKIHLLDHHGMNPECAGCIAKSRAKRHKHRAYRDSKKDHTHTVTLDQVGMVDPGRNDWYWRNDWYGMVW